MTATKNQYAMQDPLKQYPGPDFDRQPQSAPGLAKEMRPRPDHGEESYQGFGRLKGRRALITGADSGIGRAVAIAYAREGADIVMNYLPSEEADAREVRRLVSDAGVKVTAIAGDISEEAFCRELVQKTVGELGGIDILVNVAGKQTSVDSIADLSTETIRGDISHQCLRDVLAVQGGVAAHAGWCSDYQYDLDPKLSAQRFPCAFPLLRRTVERVRPLKTNEQASCVLRDWIAACDAVDFASHVA